MAVLIRRGKRVCSARCHRAKGSVCQCLCEGINYGVGLRQATVNTQKMAEKLLGQGMKLGQQAYQQIMEMR